MIKNLETLKSSIDSDRTNKKALSDQIHSLKRAIEECKLNKKKLTKKFSLKDVTIAYNSKEVSLNKLRTHEQSLMLEKQKFFKEAEILLKMIESASDFMNSL